MAIITTFEVSEKRRKIWKHFWRKAAYKYFSSFQGVLHKLNYLNFSKAVVKLPENNVQISIILQAFSICRKDWFHIRLEEISQ